MQLFAVAARAFWKHEYRAASTHQLARLVHAAVGRARVFAVDEDEPGQPHAPAKHRQDQQRALGHHHDLLIERGIQRQDVGQRLVIRQVQVGLLPIQLGGNVDLILDSTDEEDDL